MPINPQRGEPPSAPMLDAPWPAPPSLPAAASIAEAPRDTATAVEAMHLAFAYFMEFQEHVERAITDPAFAAHTLNTLSLISRQIEIAERADPSATLTVEDSDGSPITFTLTSMKANALYNEALCRADANPNKAINILEQALELSPGAPNAYYWIGMINASLLNKQAAIDAFETAAALDPSNIEFRKELVRAQAISGSQVAYDRAARGVRTTIKIGRWVWYGFWIFAGISLVVAINKGDAGSAISILFLFGALGFALLGIDKVKAWFGGRA